VVDGELTRPKLPLVPGHEVVGRVVAVGPAVGSGVGPAVDPAFDPAFDPGVERFKGGERVGIPWLGWTCGTCGFCRTGRENLCEAARFTGYTLDGGYADFTLADQRYCFALSDEPSDAAVAPLLCAGLIGYRSLKMAGEGERLGLYGFGAAAHIVAQVACHQGRRVFALTRPGDRDAQAFARDLGAVWAGDSGEAPPEPLDAAIIFT
jgi:propanol-preferring alcohol dehydrogenase